MYIAAQPEVILTSFGDMMRVPGGQGSFFDAKARGADIRMVYSPLDALKVARQNPGKRVVFMAIGFETTAPSPSCSRRNSGGLGSLTYSSATPFCASVECSASRYQTVIPL
jgi:hydrogenase expression/formation protein HypD